MDAAQLAASIYSVRPERSREAAKSKGTESTKPREQLRGFFHAIIPALEGLIEWLRDAETFPIA